jgi:hypothetical protein
MRDIELYGISWFGAVNFVWKNPNASLYDFYFYLYSSTEHRREGSPRSGTVVYDDSPECYPLATYLGLIRAHLKAWPRHAIGRSVRTVRSDYGCTGRLRLDLDFSASTGL